MKCPTRRQRFNGARLSAINKRFEPYKDVIIFVVTLLVANFFWKFTMSGDENGETVTWFGWDVTAPFYWMACHVASVVHWLVSLVRDTVYMADEQTIRFDSGAGTKIIWGCTGFKQMFIWMCLILTVRRADKTIPASDIWIKKLWYIPLGWFCCYIFNMLRIFIIALIIEQHRNWFPVMHDYIFKYLFYGILFVMWLIFVEKIRPSVSSR